MSFNARLINLLKTDPRFVDDEGELVLAAVQDHAWKIDRDLVKLLLSDKEIKAKFFDEIEGHWIFNINTFIDYISQKNFLDNSYTRFRNRIGLTIGGKYLRERGEVALVWPYKDCVLEGGQTKEEEKRKEIFFNEVLAQDEINRLLDPKVLTNFARYTAKGKQPVKEFNRDENGVIRENLIIKGNNLLALHTLKTQFRGQVKLIYIDPPYNTGNDSFGYNNSFNHSSWLTFLKNRLDVARELLRDDGIIFVQCDDTEGSYLKVLVDEIFGRNNFLLSITVVTDARTREYEAISATHEYIHVYSKSSAYKLYQLIDENKLFKYEDKNGGFDIYELRNRNTQFNSKNRPNLLYPFYVNPQKHDDFGFYEVSLEPKYGWVEVYPQKSRGIQTVWRWGRDRAAENLNTILFGKKTRDGHFQIVKKYRGRTKSVSSVWYDKEVKTDGGTLQIRALFDGKRVFEFPKPEELIARIIQISTVENDLVLDFCTGSGTTAAVAHKMNRQYIGIEQMDYTNNIPVERIKKVIAGEQGGISKSVNWQGGGDFIYCELMKYNEAFMDRIQAAQSGEELLEIWREMAENSFLNWYVNPAMPEEAVKDFEELGKGENGLEKQKRLLAELLDKNQLYVNLSEIDDAQFNVSEEDKSLNKAFYGEQI